MAQALAQGFVSAGICSPGDIVGSDVSEPAVHALANQVGATIAKSNQDLVRQSDVVLLAVKPQAVEDALGSIQDVWSDDHLLVSIAAGIPIARMSKTLGPKRRIVRVMPNTPCLVGAAASAFAIGPGATAEDAKLVEKLFTSVGIAVQVSESLLDAVTGLSGSGPAYVFQMIEALADGGVKAGLSRDVALSLAAQTVHGAAQMVLRMGKHPAELRDMVTSPAGTTIEALAVLEQRGVRSAFIDAVVAAAQRSKVLGGG